MKMHLLCPALLVVLVFCDAALGVDQECSTFNKEKIGGCNEYKGGFAPDTTYIQKPGLDGCKEVCREKGFIDGCCSFGEEDCWCALARSPEPAKPENPAKS